MTYTRDGSVLLINLFFLTIFSLYLGIIFRQALYFQDQIELRYQLQKKQYAAEALLWWGVAICTQQFDVVQKLCSQDGICTIPTEHISAGFEKDHKAKMNTTLRISSHDADTLQCEVVSCYAQERIQVSCQVCHMKHVDGTKGYRLQAFQTKTAQK